MFLMTISAMQIQWRSRMHHSYIEKLPPTPRIFVEFQLRQLGDSDQTKMKEEYLRNAFGQVP